MIEYAGRTIPDDDSQLLSLIRKEAHRVIMEEPRDERPSYALDWVSQLLQDHPDLIPRVELAYAKMLASADPVEVREVLDQASSHPGNMAPLLVEAIAEHSAALSAGEDTTNSSRSLLGAIVEKLQSIARPLLLTPESIQALGEIDAPQDGWPDSFRMALAANFDGYSSRLIATVEQIADDDDSLMSFVRGFVNAGPPLTDRGLDEIGKGPAELREKFGSALKQFVSASEATRQELLTLPALSKYPPEIQRRLSAPRPDPWPGYAARLRVAP